MPKTRIAVTLLSILSLSTQSLPSELQNSCRPASPGAAPGAWECRHSGQPFTLVRPEPLPAKPTLVVWLHGSGRNHRTLLEQPATRAALAASPHIVLMPEGGASWWIAPGVPERVLELAELAARAFHVPPERRGCGGWSMGAYGSVRLIERYPASFAAWTGILGLLDFPNSAYPERDNHRAPPLFGPPAEWPGHNPIQSIAALRGTALWFASGREAFDYRMNLAFHRRLDELAIPHEFETLAGGHVFSLVAEALPRALAFHTRVLGGPHAR